MSNIQWLNTILSCRVRSHWIQCRINKPHWYCNKLTKDKKMLLEWEYDKCQKQIGIFDEVITALPDKQRQLLLKHPYKAYKDEESVIVRKHAKKERKG
ncbi:hypothetical protein [Gottfriedia acidiceleris]|uniref:hypothetical protein n=1 Tax=Gottfriedia acidiceleris TaxID=371036 RepID=UPI003000D248